MDQPTRAVASALGYTFRDESLLVRALTHRTAVNETGRRRRGADRGDNERMEFLGDAVLYLVVSDLLVERMPGAPEGLLSRSRAAIVNEEALATVAAAIGVGEALRLGRGEARTGGRAKPSLLADALEALIAAVYADGGLEAARAVVHALLGARIAEVMASDPRDDKSLLQEILQERHHITPRYTVVGTSGPPHDRTYEVEMQAGALITTRGTGRNKQVAAQEAARRALAQLDPTLTAAALQP